jgi:hypothetical protein
MESSKQRILKTMRVVQSGVEILHSCCRLLYVFVRSGKEKEIDILIYVVLF